MKGVVGKTRRVQCCLEIILNKSNSISLNEGSCTKPTVFVFGGKKSSEQPIPRHFSRVVKADRCEVSSQQRPTAQFFALASCFCKNYE
jgi:hypothetical protein